MNINPLCFNCVSFIFNDCDGTGLNSVTEFFNGRFHFLCFEPINESIPLIDPFSSFDFSFLGGDLNDDSY